MTDELECNLDWDEHILCIERGLEMRSDWNFCPNCGEEL